MISNFKTKHWEDYRNFFQLWYIKFFITWFALVPLSYGILSEVPTRLAFSVDWAKGIGIKGQIAATEPIILNLALPFDWRLLWISSFLFFLAFVIYHFRCPQFVKRYHRFADYQAVGHDPRHIAYEAKFLFDTARVDKKKFAEEMIFKGYASERRSEVQDYFVERKKCASAFVFSHEGVTYELAMPKALSGGVANDDAVQRGVFWEIYGRYSSSRELERSAVHFLLLASFCFMLLVLGGHIVEGLDMVIDSR